MNNPFSDIGKKPISARQAAVKTSIAKNAQLLKAHKLVEELLTPSARNRLISLTRKSQLWADPLKVKKMAETEFLKILKTTGVKKAPKNRWVLLRSGPFRGQWRRVIEQKDLFSQALYTFVVSSNLSAIAYDKKTKELEVEFIKGAVYRYKNVPYSTYKGLANAGSKGKYFWKHIRGLKGKEPIYSYSRLRFRKEMNKIPKYVKNRKS